MISASFCLTMGHWCFTAISSASLLSYNGRLALYCHILSLPFVVQWTTGTLLPWPQPPFVVQWATGTFSGCHGLSLPLPHKSTGALLPLFQHLFDIAYKTHYKELYTHRERRGWPTRLQYNNSDFDSMTTTCFDIEHAQWSQDMALIGVVDRCGWWKYMFCSTRGPVSSIWSKVKPVFWRIWQFGRTYNLLRCLYLEIWWFSCWQWWRQRQTDKPIALPLVHARGVIIVDKLHVAKCHPPV